MDYIKILTDSIKLWWKHKTLWVFGIIAVIFGTGGISNTSISIPNFGNFTNNSYFSRELGNIFNSIFNTSVLTILLVLLLIGLCVVLLGIYLKSRADASIISSIPVLDKGTKMSFSQTWNLSSKNWKKLFLLNALVVLPIVLFIICVILTGIFLYVLLMRTGANFNMGTYLLILISLIIGSLCIVSIYSILARIIYTFASRLILIEDESIKQSIKNAWDFILKNISSLVVFWLLTLVMDFVIQVITIVFMFTFIIITGLISIPFFFVNIITGIVVLFFLLIILGMLSKLITGPAYALTQVYWTKVYLELKKIHA